MKRFRRIRFTGAAALIKLLMLALPTLASAQFAGHNVKGDNGLLSGSQPAPGLYTLASYYRYGGDSLRNGSGDEIMLDPQQRSAITATGFFVPIVLYVTKAKVFGADYGFLVAPGFLNKRVEAPILSLDDQSNTKLTDTYVQPVRLGWHRKQSDYLAGLGLFAPTGDYTFRGDHNTGLGMWSFELFAGATFYFDEKKTWHFATIAFYETHTKKEDTDIDVGDILTLGGVGRSFLGGGANVGIAYYAQWKLTSDDLGVLPPDFPRPDDRLLRKNRVYGVGPEITLPIATKAKLYAFANVRYFWELGARTTLQGDTLVATLTVPIPSIKLK
jgi:hypothetical protein